MIHLWKERGKNGWIWRLVFSLPVWYRRFERRGRRTAPNAQLQEVR